MNEVRSKTDVLDYLLHVQKSETSVGLGHPSCQRELQELCRVLAPQPTTPLFYSRHAQQERKQDEGLFARIEGRPSPHSEMFWCSPFTRCFEIKLPIVDNFILCI
jgi:hypothetical protein